MDVDILIFAWIHYIRAVLRQGVAGDFHERKHNNIYQSMRYLSGSRRSTTDSSQVPRVVTVATIRMSGDVCTSTAASQTLCSSSRKCYSMCVFRVRKGKLISCAGA